MLIEGVFAAVTTPFYPDQRVYHRKIEANIARYSRSLLAGMVVLGSTGEAVTLDDVETREVLRTAAAAASPEKVLIAGVGRESLKATLALAEVAREFRYDAVLVRMPTYYLPQVEPDVVLNYFRAVADRSPLPVMLYNIPKFVPYNLPVDVVTKLAQHPNIIGIKDSTGDLVRLKDLIEATRKAPTRTIPVTTIFEAVTARMLQPAGAEGSDPASFVSVGDLAGGVAVAAVPPRPVLKTRSREVGFQVLTGSAGTIMETLEAGGAGAILGFAACAPQACCEVYAAWKDHDLELAAAKQTRIAGTAQRIAGDLGISGVKYGCDFNGYYGGRPRLPLLPLTSEQKAEIESLLADTRN